MACVRKRIRARRCVAARTSGDSWELTDHDPGGLVVLALVPPDPRRSTSRSPLVVEQACRTGRTPRIRVLPGYSSSQSFRLRRSGMWFPQKDRFLGGSFGLKIERNPVHAVSEPRRTRAILEHMAKVPLAPGTMHLSSYHSVRADRSWSPRRCSRGAQKLGQPVPLSNFVSDVKSS